MSNLLCMLRVVVSGGSSMAVNISMMVTTMKMTKKKKKMMMMTMTMMIAMAVVKPDLHPNSEWAGTDGVW